ncbi:MAG: RnfABCDGE type electron transport complex subunit G [Odoribacteraceae bacterium]|jgi:electron transport complex protein RnfG|nr:RnfABCDGE type electron transport complex subunit G [Odoribacteraceae bacterium]
MGKKLESNFKNMVLVLCAIALFSSLSVASINALTVDTLNEVRLTSQLKAIRAVLPDFDNNPMDESDTLTTPDGSLLVLFPASREGVRVGTAVKSFSNNGYSGRVWLMVGFAADGSVYDYTVLEHKETPGLGSKMDVWFAKGNRGDVTGKKPGDKALRVRKDGGEVDAITAATVSSRAFLDAVNRAANALSGKVDAVSGATDATSGATGVEDATSGATDATSGATDATSGATSGATDATSGATDATSGATDAASGATNVEDAASGATSRTNRDDN